MNSEADWSATARQFQQDLGQNWTQAMQSFGGLAGGASLPAMPRLSFSAEKLQALQQAYVKEAADLWNQGLQANPAGADKRFAGDAWGANPVAAFSAAVYLLNARTLLGLAEAADTDEKTKSTAALRGRAMDGGIGAQQFHGAQCRGAEEGHRNPGREHRQGRAEPAQGHPARPCVDDGRERVRGRAQRRHDRRRRGVRERPVPAARIQAAHAQGLRAAVPGGAALHQQVLYPRPAAREFADPSPGASRATAPSW